MMTLSLIGLHCMVTMSFSDVAWLTCGVVRGSGAMGCGFRVVVCQSLPLLCVVVVVIRWSWPFVGQLLSFVVAVICWAMAVVCCTVVVIWQPGLFAVVGCVTWHGDSVLRWWWLGVEE